MRLSFLVFIMLCFYCSNAQVVNIEAQRMQSDTTGWMGGVGTNFSLEKNVQQVLNINVNAHVQYKAKKDLYLFLANYNLQKGSNETLSDNIFYHVRYNRKLNPWLRWEVFTQLQQNNITGIDVRVLAGTGPRFKLHADKAFNLYAATAVMYEYEKEKTSPPVYHNDVRSSSYVSLTVRPTKGLEIISTTFYQPLFSNVSDYRLLNEINVSFKITQRLAFSMGWFYLFDNYPAAQTPKVNYRIGNGIRYDF